MTDTTTETREQGQTTAGGLGHDPPNECLFCGGPKHPKETDCPDYPHYANLPTTDRGVCDNGRKSNHVMTDTVNKLLGKR